MKIARCLLVAGMLVMLGCSPPSGTVFTPTPDNIDPKPPGTPPTSGMRDKYLQPFASNSIWNTAIGRGADYRPAGFQDVHAIDADEDLFFVLRAEDPERRVYNPQSWGQRCGGTQPHGELRLRLPDTLIVPDAAPPETPNNSAALLLPNWRTMVQLNAFTRCDQGGPAYGYWITWGQTQDIYGDGIRGAHAGSGLSSIGGTIRKGELTGADQIRHALKVNVFGMDHLHYNNGRGFVWPADRHDSNASQTYQGTNPLIRMGTLLAIPTNVPLDSLQLETEPAKKLYWTLQNYGAYIVDNSGWDAYAFAVEKGVPEQFLAAYGHRIDGYASLGSWFRDVNKLFKALHVVANNTPSNIGGGGEPLQPPPPPIGN